jgi:hypothetical protein
MPINSDNTPVSNILYSVTNVSESVLVFGNTRIDPDQTALISVDYFDKIQALSISGQLTYKLTDYLSSQIDQELGTNAWRFGGTAAPAPPPSWGGIGGTITNQTDLINLVNNSVSGKLDTSLLADATNGGAGLVGYDDNATYPDASIGRKAQALTAYARNLTGTPNQVILTPDVSGNLTFSLPQDIGTLSSPSFASLSTTAACQFPGMVSGSTPASGVVGEYLSNQLTSDVIALSNTPQGVIGLTLPAGNFIVQGLAVFNVGSGTLTYSGVGIGVSTTVLPPDPYVSVNVRNATTPQVNPRLLSPPRFVHSTSSSVTYYLIVQAAFSASCTVDGYIWAYRWC